MVESLAVASHHLWVFLLDPVDHGHHTIPDLLVSWFDLLWWGIMSRATQLGGEAVLDASHTLHVVDGDS